MKPAGACLLSCIICFLGGLFQPLSAGSFLYKTYDVHYDQGREILCEAYIVQRNDWVYRLLREKGEIAEKDYPEFVRIFKNLNPQVTNIDQIRTGQPIIIPLKVITPNSFPNQHSGKVTVPFVTISKIASYLKTATNDYRIQPGDCVSKIVADRFGNLGTGAYQEGVHLFKLANPQIRNMNLLQVGRIVKIPDVSILRQPWYGELRNFSAKPQAAPKAQPPLPARSDPPPPAPGSPAPGASSSSALSQLAGILDARLLNRGTYFFPKSGEQDFSLDLAKYPILQLPDQSRAIFVNAALSAAELSAIRAFWKDIHLVPAPVEASTAAMLDAFFRHVNQPSVQKYARFADHGVEVEVRAEQMLVFPATAQKNQHHLCITRIDAAEKMTSWPVCRYLEQNGIRVRDIFQGRNLADGAKVLRQYQIAAPPQVVRVTLPADTPQINGKSFEHFERGKTQRAFIQNLMATLGFDYAENVNVTFPYAGIQIKAMADLISTGKQAALFLDFGNIYGDAFNAIRQAGFSIVRIQKQDNPLEIIEKLFKALGFGLEKNPTLFGAKRPIVFNTAITIPGFVFQKKAQDRGLITTAPLNAELVQFLLDQQYKIILLTVTPNRL